MVTNTTPVGAYRGAGRPEATAAVERAIDLFAAEIGMDPAEVRAKNLLPPFTEPHTTAFGAMYDTGDYPAALDKALAAADYAGPAGRAGQAAGLRATWSSWASACPATWRSPGRAQKRAARGRTPRSRCIPTAAPPS